MAVIGKKWTKEEKETITKLVEDDVPPEECAKILSRSVGAVNSMRSKLGLYYKKDRRSFPRPRKKTANRLYLNVKQMARALRKLKLGGGCSEQHIRDEIERGRIPAVKSGGEWKCHKEEWAKYVELLRKEKKVAREVKTGMPTLAESIAGVNLEEVPVFPPLSDEYVTVSHTTGPPVTMPRPKYVPTSSNGKAEVVVTIGSERVIFTPTVPRAREVIRSLADTIGS